MNYIEIVYAFFSYFFFFSIIFNLRGEKLFFSSFCGARMVDYFILTTSSLFKTCFFFIAAIIITIFSEIVAKELETPVTTTLIPALIPLVPEVEFTILCTILQPMNFYKLVLPECKHFLLPLH